MVGPRTRRGCVLALSLVAASPLSGMTRSEVPQRVSLQTDARIPFVANAGQVDQAVAYYTSVSSGDIFVTRRGRIVYSLTGRNARSWTITETPRGARSQPKGIRPTPTSVSYFLGTEPARWKSKVETFGTVSLGQVWPGVSLDLVSNGGSVEKIFTVAPGGSPSLIEMGLAGALRMSIHAGSLIIRTGMQELSFSPPAAFQILNGVRHPVRVAYELRGRGYGFRLGKYDPKRPVVIDPLLEATFLGGSFNDWAFALAIHPTSGQVYVAGSTGSVDFPGTAGGAQPAKKGPGAIFVARLNASLTRIEQATFLGGSLLLTGEFDEAYALAINPVSGDVYVAGTTPSTTFPGTAGGAQPVYGGDRGDGFVARLDASLTKLEQSTYLGGSGFDRVNAIAIHPASGDVYVAGYTLSTDLPGTAGSAQETNRSCCTGFVARLNSALTELKRATYLGGTASGDVEALAIHPASGEVYVAGGTLSIDSPGTEGGAQPANAGGADAFVARLNAALTRINQATYLGGSGPPSDGYDWASALAIHPTTGEVYIAGSTRSSNFPGTTGGAQPAFGGGYVSGFVAVLNPALTGLRQATYLGGSVEDEALSLGIHPITGDAYVAGFTRSGDFPGTASGVQRSNAGDLDAFIARLNPALTTLDEATYLGGSSSAALAIHPLTGEVYVAGSASGGFPVTGDAAQPVLGGSVDGFIARLTSDLMAPPARLEIRRILPNSVPRVLPGR
jgi:hypothetical protein